MFAIGDNEWPGLGKIIKESGELGQILGKIIAVRGSDRHFDQSDLIGPLTNELGDLIAALEYFIKHNPQISREEVFKRSKIKYDQYMKWHEE